MAVMAHGARGSWSVDEVWIRSLASRQVRSRLAPYHVGLELLKQLRATISI
jgi:hypothetical protein